MTALDKDVHRRPRYGILGGTFDPPHYGHLVLAQEAHVRLGLERVWFVPTGAPPHKPGQLITEARHRLAMVSRAIAGNERFALSEIEVEHPGPSYTVETLHALREHWGPRAWLCLILGWDMLISLPEWHDPEGVLAGTDQVVAAHRPGYCDSGKDLDTLEARFPGLLQKLALLPAPQLELAATSIRERVALGLPIRYLVPDAVVAYVERQGLYRPEKTDSITSEPDSEGKTP
jgi:nicotinate-nucleotide adenylyltransferase